VYAGVYASWIPIRFHSITDVKPASSGRKASVKDLQVDSAHHKSSQHKKSSNAEATLDHLSATADKFAAPSPKTAQEV